MITLSGCYFCHWLPVIERGDAPTPLPMPREGEGMCPTCCQRMYHEVLTEDAEEE